MKITYVIEDFSVGGGVERVVSEKANYLATRHGHDVTLVSIYLDDRGLSYHLEPGVRLVSLNVPMAKRSHNAVKRTLYRLSTLVRAAVRLNQELAKIQPDVIFFATTLSALLLPLCRVRARKIFESHSARLFTPYNSLFKPMERSADMVVCLTEDDAREYSGAKRVMVIPNFVNAPTAFVSDYGTKAAIAVGRLETVKGFDLLIEAWRKVAESWPDWRLDIYGEGSERDNLQSLIKAARLDGKVNLMGRIDNIMEVYTRYSLHVMTSRYEGQPMTLIEAQACGLPSVVFDFKYGARDIVKSDVNGLLVSQGDVAALADAIDAMIGSEERRRQYGMEARKTASRFSRDKILKMWDQLIASQATRQ